MKYNFKTSLSFHEWLKSDFVLKKYKSLKGLTSKEIEKAAAKEYKEYLDQMANYNQFP